MKNFATLLVALFSIGFSIENADGQARRIQFEFAPGSSYTYFPGQFDSPELAACGPNGCSFEISGLFDLAIASDRSATIENANVMLSGNDLLDGSQFDVSGLLNRQFLTLREESGTFGTTYDLSNFPPPLLADQSMPFIPLLFRPGLQLDFGFPIVGTAFPDRLVGGPNSLAQGSAGYEFNASLRQVSVVSIPEPAMLQFLCTVGLGSVLRRKRSD